MKSSKGTAFSGLKLLMGGASMVALTAVTVLSGPAMAQDAAPAASGDKDVVVVGVRRALKTAQQIKKDADTVVDTITASDIGSFPDKSVAEALQRVAGITVNRFAATGDTAHFSAEPSGVVVRGLQQVRSEFNGRDIFSADSNRGLSWSDVSPELMGGVDTYKNQTAELIEGGIAGTINLRTRLPFDQKGRVLAATAEYTYGDLVNKGAAGFSGIYADRFDTELGEFGVMINAAHSEVITNSQGIQYGRIVPVVNSYWGNKVFVPVSTSMRDNVYDRTRDGVSAALQWQNKDHTMLATLQYNQSKKVEQWEEYVATASTGVDAWAQQINFNYTGSNLECLGGRSACTTDAQGRFQNGTLVNSNGAWYGSWAQPTGVTSPNGLMRGCYSWESACGNTPQRAPGFESSTRWSDSLNDTKDIGFNLKWDVTQKLKANFDIQYVDATQKNYDISVGLQTYAQANLDATGDHPVLTLANSAVGWYLAPGGISNANNYRMHWIMDHVTDSEGHEFATRADLAYSFDSPWLNTLKAGVRYADREQTVRWTTYNWASVVNNWSSYDANNYYITGSAFPTSSAYGLHTFNQNFYQGSNGSAINISDVVFFSMDKLKDQAGLAKTFDLTHYTPKYTDGTVSNTWSPICYRSGEGTGDADCFRPAEIADVSEKTKAVYVQLKFGGPDASIFGGINVVGNIGVRYVETTNESTGGVIYPSSSIVYDTTPLVETAPGSGIFRPSFTYYIAADDRAFLGTQNNTVQTSTTVHKNWLPSFNVRLGLTDKWFVRFAASRALSRPDIGNLKKYTSIGVTIPSTTTATLDCNPTTGAFICNTNGSIQKTKLTYTANANNPTLSPVTADQFDLTLENYFSQTGSFTVSAFYKKFYDYIQYGRYTTQFTNAGITKDVVVSGPVNGDGASIKGIEVAYTSFFDFLPAPFDGFGVQTNYTYIQNSGITSSGVVVNSGDGSSGQLGGSASGTSNSANAAISYTNLPLEGLSENSYNLIGMYEKGAWSARLAYNWRSEYLVTSQDCCVVFPIWQKAAGYLDARVAYRINSNVEVSLEGSNLLNTETVLQQQVSGPMSNGVNNPTVLMDSSWFRNDRRLQASLRLKF